MNAREKQIQETLESIDSVSLAEVPFGLENKILQRVQTQKEKIISLQTKMIWRAAACVVVLVGINIFSIVHFNQSKVETQINSNPLATEYFSYITNS